MSLSYDPTTILGFALEWFERHEDQRPRCTCSTNQWVTETLSTSVHKETCPVYDFVRQGWHWGVDRYMEMQSDAHT